MAKLEKISLEKVRIFLKKNKSKVKLDTSDSIQFCNGDLKLLDLEVNDKDLILINGDLVVKNLIFDVGAYNESDYGHLIVSGSIVCGSMVWGGSSIEIKSGIVAQKFIYFNSWGLGHFNAGSLLKSPLLISEDNEITSKSFEVDQVYTKDPDSWWSDGAQQLTPGTLPKKLFKKNFIDVNQLKKASKSKVSILKK